MAGMIDKGVLARVGAPALGENDLNDAWADLRAVSMAGRARHPELSLRPPLTEPVLLDKAVALAAREIAGAGFPR
jgi:zinc protease